MAYGSCAPDAQQEWGEVAFNSCSPPEDPAAHSGHSLPLAVVAPCKIQQPQAYSVLSHLHEAPGVLLPQGKERAGNSAPMLLPGPWITF